LKDVPLPRRDNGGRSEAAMKYPCMQAKYGIVKAFYHIFKDEVEIVELGNYINISEV